MRVRNALLVAAVSLTGAVSAAGSAQAASTFLDNESWTLNPYYGSRGTFFADVTGDGKADAIAVNDDRVWVRPSDGGEFIAQNPVPWTAGAFYGSRGTFFADVTGDGAADAIAVNNNLITVRRAA